MKRLPNGWGMTFCAFAIMLGLFFLTRGLWVGVEGWSGKLPLDGRDWKLVGLFIFIGACLISGGVAKLRAFIWR